MPVSWQTRFFSESATCTFFRMVFSTRCPGTDVSLRAASGRTVAAQHVRKRDLGVLGLDPGRIQVDGGPAVRRLDALALLDLLEDRLRNRVARAERVRELLAVHVDEHGTVRPGRLRDR